MELELDPQIVAAVQRAIRDTITSDALIDQPHLLDRRVFRFCQYLRSVVAATTPARALLAYVELWWDACAEAVADDQDNTGETIDLSWRDVCRQFEAVWTESTIYPIGDYWLGMGCLPIPDLPCITRYERQYVRRLVAAMYHASRNTPEHTFYLTQADAGRVMDRSQPWGRHVIAMLIADGVIRKLKPGHSGVAPLYQWLAC